MTEEKSNNKYLIVAVAILLVIIVGLSFAFYTYHKGHSGNTKLSSCISASQAWNNIGKTGCVSFNVGYTYISSRGNAYLDQYQNYSSGVEVWIPARYSFGRSLTNQYVNKNINVSGTITRYQGAPEIEVTDPSQVQLAQ